MPTLAAQWRWARARTAIFCIIMLLIALTLSGGSAIPATWRVSHQAPTASPAITIKPGTLELRVIGGPPRGMDGWPK